MRQSRKVSAIEAFTSVAIGFCVSWVLTFYVLPWWGFEPSIRHASEITAVYTVASIIRSYAVRRIFNGLR